MNLSDPVLKLGFVGPTFAKRLEKLGIKTIDDLLFHFPFRYDDYSLFSSISQTQPGETVTIRGVVEKIINEYTKNGKKIQKATIMDKTGQLEAVWFNQPYLIKTFKKGEVYNFSGKIEWFGRQKILQSPEFELANTPTTCKNNSFETLNNIHTGRLVPVYNETYGVSSKWLRSRIKTALQRLGGEIQEFLPEEIIKKERLIREKEAIFQIHFPDSKDLSEKARERLAFDELFLIQLLALLRKKEWASRKNEKKIIIFKDKLDEFISSLPFTLTDAQKRCINEIVSDMEKDLPMNRLLEGDVGSGKTVVAATACYLVFLNGFQSLFMAPTEILAQQHYNTLKNLLAPFGVPIELITGSSRTKNKKGQDDKTTKVIVGTHSLLFRDFDEEKIGLVIVDEQHRFGVEQRSLLGKKGGTPHFLTMTATPIPRSIALTLYGDLDLSIIDEMPQGRQKVKTWVVPKTKRNDCYQWIKTRIKENKEQAFIVCPFIEESESLISVKAAKKEFELLTSVVFQDLKLGLLHGKLKPKEKDQILNDFKEGKFDILVSTPVVEVGIDIPGATIILIEGADRFGLAQLHQLRGRVGRRNASSFCFLFTENENPGTINRLKTLEKTNVGMELAEIDLKIRGPGEIYGIRQHGFPDLKVASLSDILLIQRARKAVNLFMEKYLSTIEKNALQTRLKKYKIDIVNN